MKALGYALLYIGDNKLSDSVNIQSFDNTREQLGVEVPRRRLGKSGLEVSEIGLGCWQLGGEFGAVSDQQAQEVLAAAHRHSINFWDTADVYGGGLSERRIADWLYQEKPQERPIIASKVGRNAELYPQGYSKDNLRRSIEGSLDRLQLTCIDLIQLHCIPEAELQKDEVWTSLEDFCAEGLIKHYGASVETIAQARMCVDKPGLTSLQMIVNLFRQDVLEDFLQEAEQQQVGIIARLPLASGALADKYTAATQFAESDHRNFNKDGQAFSVGETFSGIPYEKILELVVQLREYCPEGMTMTQLALRWLLDLPQISSVIVGAKSAQQVYDNAYVSGVSRLSESLHHRLNKFYWQDVRDHIRVEI